MYHIMWAKPLFLGRHFSIGPYRHLMYVFVWTRGKGFNSNEHRSFENKCRATAPKCWLPRYWLQRNVTNLKLIKMVAVLNSHSLTAGDVIVLSLKQLVVYSFIGLTGSQQNLRQMCCSFGPRRFGPAPWPRTRLKRSELRAGLNSSQLSARATQIIRIIRIIVRLCER